MTNEQISDNGQTGLKVPSLARARMVTCAAIMVERVWPLVLPAFMTVSAVLIVSWGGLFRFGPNWLRFALLSMFGIALLVSLWRLRRFRLPSKKDVDDRLEARNLLLHKPIAAQADHPSGNPGDFANVLWAEHQRRMAGKLGGVRAANPAPRTYELDRFALRALPALGLFVAFAFSYGSLGGKLSDIWNGQAAVPPVPPRVDAWVTPPRYTGKAPLFLTGINSDLSQAFTVPENSELTVRIGSEAVGEFSLLADGKPLQAPPVAEAAIMPASGKVLKGLLTKDGAIVLQGSQQLVSSWAFKVLEDKPPAIVFTADPTAASNGALTLAYKIVDDYGASKAAATFKASDTTAEARPLFTMPDLTLSVPKRSGNDGSAKISKDLTEHPLAGGEFEISLRVEDGAGQAAVSEIKRFSLPEFYFANPLARALGEDRRLLARDANDKSRVIDYLDALMTRPEETITSASHYLGISTARTRLRAARTDDQLREVVAYLWEVAREIDRNSMSDAQRRLKQAQDKLAQALENGANDQEIEKLMRELRQAMNEYMKQLAQEAEKNPRTAQSDKDTQELRASDLEKMLDQLEDLAKQGAKDKAKQLLSQLNEMMNNLEARKGNKGGEGQSEMEGKLNELGKMLRDQKKLLDETYQKGRERGDQGDEGAQQEQGQQGEGKDGQQGEGQKPGEGQGTGELARRQNDLGKRLNDMVEGLRGLGIEPGQELSDAGKAMGRAGKKLGEGNAGEATGDQSDALDSLRKGARSLMDQMKQAMGEQGGGQKKGGKRGPNDRDPLGRPNATEGPDLGQSTKVPDEIDIQRAREILDAIRKRLGNALSPEVERNYLERLLRFE